jgi:predicted transcriptional regulator
MLSIGRAIREARLESLLTLQDIADKVGVTAQAVSNWENGRSEPSEHNREILGKHLPALKNRLLGSAGDTATDGAERLRLIAERVGKGDEQTATVREILSWFGAYRRGYWIVEEIRAALKLVGLTTVPDFEAGYIDGQVQFQIISPPAPLQAEQEPTESAVEAPAADDVTHTSPDIAPVYSDPTYRISRFTATNRPVVSVAPDAPLEEAVTLMLLNDYSQLPVMTSDREVKGIITWASIGNRLSRGRKISTVKDFMVDHQELRAEESLSRAIPIIAEHGYVLVRSADRRIAGIVAASDLALQYHQLAEPFLLLGEIENHIRRLIDGRFTVEELASAKDPSDETRTISGVDDLAFGEYVRLLENPDRWARLELAVERKAVMATLRQVRDVRNDVMHFDPDPIQESDLRTLRGFAAFLRGLQRPE